MIEVSCSRVIVKDEHGNVIIDWTASLFTEIILKTGAGKTVIEKRGVFGQQTYIPAMNESIETKNLGVTQLGLKVGRFRAESPELKEFFIL